MLQASLDYGRKDEGRQLERRLNAFWDLVSLGIVKRLRQDRDLFPLYNQVICEQIEQGIVEVVPHPNESKGCCVHYLPHHAVVKHDKDNTKVRIVYNASARSGAGTSLNDALLVGPKFNQRILDILLRFRSFQTALVADIKKAFLMVGVDEGDQDVLCFLRLKDRKQEPS